MWLYASACYLMLARMDFIYRPGEMLLSACLPVCFFLAFDSHNLNIKWTVSTFPLSTPKTLFGFSLMSLEWQKNVLQRWNFFCSLSKNVQYFGNLSWILADICIAYFILDESQLKYTYSILWAVLHQSWYMDYYNLFIARVQMLHATL